MKFGWTYPSPFSECVTFCCTPLPKPRRRRMWALPDSDFGPAVCFTAVNFGTENLENSRKHRDLRSFYQNSMRKDGPSIATAFVRTSTLSMIPTSFWLVASLIDAFFKSRVSSPSTYGLFGVKFSIDKTTDISFRPSFWPKKIECIVFGKMSSFPARSQELFHRFQNLLILRKYHRIRLDVQKCSSSLAETWNFPNGGICIPR